MGARAAFLEGAALVKQTKWSEALAAFERSNAVKSHAITTYNIGACLRALGRYVLARKQFLAALAEDKGVGGGQLSEALRADIEAAVQQIEEQVIARAHIRMKPVSAAIAIDGRPLEPAGRVGKRPLLLAGTLRSGPGKSPRSAEFDVWIDPGARVITLSREGYKNAVVNRTFEPGVTVDLDLTIARLPATVRINADPDGAIVTVDGRDVGMAPVDVSRRAGTYRVIVDKEGYVPYEQTVSLAAGQTVSIRAKLPLEKPALYERWWFWTMLGGVIASMAVTSYVVLRPEPEEPPCDGGVLGWCIEAR